MRIIRLEDVTEFPTFRELTPEELKEAYALLKAAFTAEDLQKYTEEDDGRPLEELIEELEAIQKELDEKSP